MRTSSSSRFLRQALRLLAGCLLLAGLAGPAGAGTRPLPGPAPADGTVRIVGYNIYNWLLPDVSAVKSPESRDMTVSILASLNPDIAVLVETGGMASVGEITGRLAKFGLAYPFATSVTGEDQDRHIAVIAKTAPVQVAHEENLTYNLFGRAVPVQRGFAHLVFAWPDGWRLHLIGVHLKSKVFDARGQTDMRRYEARLLRYLVNRIQADEPDANILIMGDFNDTPESSPLNTLFSRRSKPALQLYDLRPLDGGRLSWTHLQDDADTYSRIDYALVSQHLLPSVRFEETAIPDIADWFIASDHRPVVVTLETRDLPLAPERLRLFERNIRQPVPPTSFFHEGPVNGTRKAQRTRSAGGAVGAGAENGGSAAGP